MITAAFGDLATLADCNHKRRWLVTAFGHHCIPIHASSVFARDADLIIFDGTEPGFFKQFLLLKSEGKLIVFVADSDFNPVDTSIVRLWHIDNEENAEEFVAALL